jgi:rubrerythrin
MYPRMAKDAREEGFEKNTKMFEGIVEVEKKHEKRYKKLLDNLEKGKVFKHDGKVYWKCRNCGYIH